MHSTIRDRHRADRPAVRQHGTGRFIDPRATSSNARPTATTTPGKPGSSPLRRLRLTVTAVCPCRFRTRASPLSCRTLPTNQIVANVRDLPRPPRRRPASSQGKTTVVAALARLHARQGKRVRVLLTSSTHADPCHCQRPPLREHRPVDVRRGRRALAACRGGEGCRPDPDRRRHGPLRRHAVGRRTGDDARHPDPDRDRWRGDGLQLRRHCLRPQALPAGHPLTAAFANRVGSNYHADLLRQSLPEDIRWMGHLPRDEFAAMPERHLGLLPPPKSPTCRRARPCMADALAQTDAASLPPAVDFADVPPRHCHHCSPARRLLSPVTPPSASSIRPTSNACRQWGDARLSRRWRTPCCPRAMRSGCLAATQSCTASRSPPTAHCGGARQSMSPPASRSSPSAAA